MMRTRASAAGNTTVEISTVPRGTSLVDRNSAIFSGFFISLSCINKPALQVPYHFSLFKPLGVVKCDYLSGVVKTDVQLCLLLCAFLGLLLFAIFSSASSTSPFMAIKICTKPSYLRTSA